MSGGRREAEERAQSPRGVIIKIDSRQAEETLFKQMAYQISEDTRLSELPEEIEKIKDIPMKISTLLHFLTKHYLSVPLGGQIISPLFGKEIVIDRIAQFSEMLLSVINNRLLELQHKIEEKKMKGEDFEEEIREILTSIDISFIVVRELINRQLTAVHINAPVNLRPPLANVKIGFEKIE